MLINIHVFLKKSYFIIYIEKGVNIFMYIFKSIISWFFSKIDGHTHFINN